MTDVAEKTLKPWRLRLALRLLGIEPRLMLHRVLIEKNVATVWDRPNPHDAGQFITFTHGKDVR